MYNHTVTPRSQRKAPKSYGTKFSIAASRAKRDIAKKLNLKTRLNVSEEPHTVWFVVWGIALCCFVSVSVFFILGLIRNSVSYEDPQEEYLKDLQESQSGVSGTLTKDLKDLLDTVLVNNTTGEVGSKKEDGVITSGGKVQKKSGKKSSQVTTREEAVVQGIIPPSDAEAEALGIPKVQQIENEWLESEEAVKSFYSKIHSRLETSEWDVRRDLVYDMDLMQLMKLEYEKTRTFLNMKLILHLKEVSLFDATSHALGGLLGAYEMSKRSDNTILDSAKELGNQLLRAWEDDKVFPRSVINLKTGHATYYEDKQLLLREVGSLPLEFTALSAYTGDKQYAERVKNIHENLRKLITKDEGIYPKQIDSKTEKFNPSATIAAGSTSDAFLQVLLKSWVLSGYKDKSPLSQFLSAVDAINKKLVTEVKKPGKTYFVLADYINGQIIPVMEESACYYPGMLAEAVLHSKYVVGKTGEELLGEHEDTLHGREKDFMELAQSLIESCYQLYKQSPSGLAPEAISFTTDAWNVLKDHNKHRPETLRSLYYMVLATSSQTEKKKYRTMGSEIFKAMAKADEKAESEGNETKMMAQTLRFAYLLFANESLIDHTKTVLSTEGHPLAIIDVN